jgi:hypothetical protein
MELVRMVLSAPLRADTWRRAVYALIALPLVFVQPVWAARRLLGLRVEGWHASGIPARRRIGHAVVSVPLNAATLVVTGYVLIGIALNVAYPIRVEGFPGVLAHPLTPYDSLAGAWGGPTLAGAWAVHALGGLVVFGIVGAWVIRGLTWLQGRLLLGILRPAPGMTAA